MSINTHMMNSFFIGTVFKAKCTCGWRMEVPSMNLAGLDYDQRRAYAGVYEHQKIARGLAKIERDKHHEDIVEQVSNIDKALERAAGPMIHG